MTQEDKELLLQDLCARLPYDVKCEVKGEKKIYTLNRIEIDYKQGHLFDFIEQKNGFNMQVYTSEVKPYLFPMSSMTEEQEKEFGSLIEVDIYGIGYDTVESIDWLNKNHFDFRDLIPKGLAKDATGLNIYY